MNESTRPAIEAASGPLVVDLDGTLLRTDLLYEKFAQLIFTKPWLLLLVPFWLLRGKARLKQELARHTALDVDSLPVNAPLLEWLRAEKARGRTLALVSASTDTVVRRVAARFGDLFDVVQGSDGATNLAGPAKLAFLKGRFGSGFTYVGDEQRDIVIWEHCRSAVLAGRGCDLRTRLSTPVVVAGEFRVPRVTPATWFRALRVPQWAKNALVFVPLLLSGNALDADLIGTVALGFLALSLLASGTYLLNDMVDLTADRTHRTKMHRPLASGELPLRAALLTVPVMFLAIAALLAVLPIGFAVSVLTYLAVTLGYSFGLKRVPILDVLVIAFLFTLRIVAGMTLSGSPLSPWLLVFSMFFFFSLATVKRFGECRLTAAEGRSALAGRGYQAQDGVVLMAVGVASGFCSSLVFFLFLVDPASPVSQYTHPQLLWIVSVVLAYWLSRTWLLAGRDQMHDDVVIFALKDPLSLALGGLCAVLGLLANL